MAPWQGLKTAILRQHNLTEFFRDTVKSAVGEVRVDLAEITEFYLVNLLHEFQRTERLFEQQPGTEAMEETPLAVLLARALAGDRSERIRALKKIGDSSLYVAGFFPARAARRLVAIDYYINMGGTAYRNLAQILANQRTFAEIFAELGEKFADCVEVLAVTKRVGRPYSNVDLLSLYERWLETGSERLGDLLKQEGIVLTPQTKTPQ
ncbi:MAG: hypothetical protein HYV03_01950 [Deltaproteobacteria bacterium]|nr:hypothetical protein [Deltaproteobacteria bacterium]